MYQKMDMSMDSNEQQAEREGGLTCEQCMNYSMDPNLARPCRDPELWHGLGHGLRVTFSVDSVDSDLQDVSEVRSEHQGGF